MRADVAAGWPPRGRRGADNIMASSSPTTALRSAPLRSAVNLKDHTYTRPCSSQTEKSPRFALATKIPRGCAVGNCPRGHVSTNRVKSTRHVTSQRHSLPSASMAMTSSSLIGTSFSHRLTWRL